MKLPRNLDGEVLAKRLDRIGFQRLHQTGSHIICRYTSTEFSHTEPIPKHSPLKVGTLASILRRIADKLGIDRNELLKKLDL